MKTADYQGKLPGTNNPLSSAKSAFFTTHRRFFFFLLGYMKFNSLGVFLINKHPVLRKNLALETLYKYQSFTIVCKLVPCMTFL